MNKTGVCIQSQHSPLSICCQKGEQKSFEKKNIDQGSGPCLIIVNKAPCNAVLTHVEKSKLKNKTKSSLEVYCLSCQKSQASRPSYCVLVVSTDKYTSQGYGSAEINYVLAEEENFLFF